MRDFRDAKAMAQTLRDALQAKSLSLTHSESLELVAKVLGFHDWNVLSARIASERQQSVAGPAAVAATRVATTVTATTVPLTALPPILAGAGLPAVPLRDLVLLPQMIVPLFVGRDTSKRAVERAMAGDKHILAVTQRSSADDNPARDALYAVGVTASVIDLATAADGTLRLIVKGLERAALLHLAAGEFLAAEIALIAESRSREAEAFTLSQAVLERFPGYLNVDLLSQPYARLRHFREPGVLADAVAAILPIEIAQRQDLLETGDVITRLEKILALMKSDRPVGLAADPAS
jgi:ATP-dependent Lon protease